MKRYEFHYAFQLTRKIIFEVSYYTLGSNKTPYFTTSASEFNQPKTDWCRCGQAQKDLCFGLAKKFYEKWDVHHLHILNDDQFAEVVQDLEELKKTYNYIAEEAVDHPDDLRFWQLKELSMQKVKKI